MYTIILLYSRWLNSFAMPVRSRNYKTYPRGDTCWDFIDFPKFPSNVANIFLLCRATSCVWFNENTGSLSSLIGLQIIFLIVANSHEACDLLKLILPLIITVICLPLSRSWHWLSMVLFLLTHWGVMSLGLVWVSVGEVNINLIWCKLMIVCLSVWNMSPMMQHWVLTLYRLFCLCISYVIVCVCVGGSWFGFWDFGWYVACLELGNFQDASLCG